jgi:hypothetical protein
MVGGGHRPTRLGLVAGSTLPLGLVCAPAAVADVALAHKQGAISAVLNDKQRDALTQSAAASAAAAEGYGHVLLMRRHLAPAAWMCAAAVEREPARGNAITALGVTLV